MTDSTEMDPPPMGEGASEVVRFALVRVRQELNHSRQWLVEVREQLEIAEMMFHEATIAERELVRLVDGEMYIGHDRWDARHLDCEAWGLSECEDPDWVPPASTPIIVEAPEVKPERPSQPIAIAPRAPWREKRPSSAKATPEELEERVQAVLAALPALWARGGRIIARDVCEATGLRTNGVYVAIQTLKERGQIDLVPVPVRPGDKRLCKDIRQPAPRPRNDSARDAPKTNGPVMEVSAEIPKAKPDRSVMGVLQRLWPLGDVTLSALANELRSLGRDYSEKILLHDLQGLERSKWLRLKDRDGSVLILAPVTEAASNEVVSPRKLERAKKLVSDGLTITAAAAMADIPREALARALQGASA